MGDFDYLNCLHSFITENKLKIYENIFKNYYYYYVEMPKKRQNILKYNYGEEYMKIPFFIYSCTDSLLHKTDACHSNPEKSSTTKINKQMSSDHL